jgi:hypothetical protein
MITKEQQQIIWAAYEQRQNKLKFDGLSREQIKAKYLGLSQEDREKAYAQMTQEQQKVIWDIAEEVKREKEDTAKHSVDFELEHDIPQEPASNFHEARKSKMKKSKVNKDHVKPPEEEPAAVEDDTVDLVALPASLRKNMIDSLSNEGLVKAYKKINTDEGRATVWAALSPEQRNVIMQAAELEKNQKRMEELKRSRA